MGDDSEWMKLPVDQKCEHKVTAGSLVFVSFLVSSAPAARAGAPLQQRRLWSRRPLDKNGFDSVFVPWALNLKGSELLRLGVILPARGVKWRRLLVMRGDSGAVRLI